jgi:1,2-diacylglycerol 3-beta-galactosyltransferase
MSNMAEPRPEPEPVLFLTADTGGGHRAAAQAVAQALRAACPGRFTPVLLDPLGGPGSAWPLRCLMRCYGPAVRYAPWLWGALYRITDSAAVAALLRRTVLRLAEAPVREAVAALRPAALVSCHALATGAAVRAAGTGPSRLPVVTVVTDLATVHASWSHPGSDVTVACSAGPAAGRPRGGAPAGRRPELGLPVSAQFSAVHPAPAQREALRRSLGLDGHRFVVVVTGGGEGAGRMYRSVRALLAGLPGADVVAICGRNDRVRRRLGRLSAGAAGRLTVLGFVGNMADWLRCADVVVGKAGPGTIAEAACCGAAMILTCHLPGQEAGNTELAVRAGAARHAHRITGLVHEVGQLRDDPASLAAMRAASQRLGRPGAAQAIAELVASLAGARRAGHTARAGAPRRESASPRSAGPPVPAHPAPVPAAAGERR